MPADATLLSRHYTRLICVTVPCHCGARRGELCFGFRLRRVLTPHADRLVAHNYWKKENPEQYAKLRAQIEAEIINGKP